MLSSVLNEGGMVSNDISTKFLVLKRYSTMFFCFSRKFLGI